LDDARGIALDIGFPILIKASAGGGGRGMRVANNMDEFNNAYETARSEAINAFGDGTMYLEKFVLNPKHIEFQMMADKYGNVVHLGERDCSIQRRNQKVLEEAPSLISEDLRRRMGEAAILACRSVNYENAGTIEFLLSGEDFYFIEMNTRIQVEHPVTEMVTGIDIIKEQIKVAAGKELSFKQEDIVLKGHSIEVRINAEDPKHGFRPNPGTISLLHVPSGNGIRFDSFIYSGYSIPPFYDSMLGKVIVHGEDRIDAIYKMKATLEELVIGGVTTNQDFCYMILNNSEYVKGKFDTGFIGMKIDSLLADLGTFVEKGHGYITLNPLFQDGYEEKISSYKEKTNLDEAYIYGYCEINGMPTVIGVMDSHFLMGSMGSVVGEKVTKSFEYAIYKKLPIIIFTASGGARMQEGIFSLMQMAKTSAAAWKFAELKQLYISVLTNPTTGGVTASFASLGDIILAEPNALIGFAGPRVIEQTINQKLPKGFQRSEFLEQKGFIDKVVHRDDMKETLGKLLLFHRRYQ
jgi:acetyl-CoA carboxylase carboxyl transferase beta subunit